MDVSTRPGSAFCTGLLQYTSLLLQAPAVCPRANCTARRVSWGECPATAEGPTSPSSGSYSAAGPAQGWPPGTAERRGGQRGSRRRPSGRSSQSGGRAGARKGGEKDVVTQCWAQPSSQLLPRHLPQWLLFYHHLQKPALSFQSSRMSSMKPSTSPQWASTPPFPQQGRDPAFSTHAFYLITPIHHRAL